MLPFIYYVGNWLVNLFCVRTDIALELFNIICFQVFDDTSSKPESINGVIRTYPAVCHDQIDKAETEVRVLGNFFQQLLDKMNVLSQYFAKLNDCVEVIVKKLITNYVSFST